MAQTRRIAVALAVLLATLSIRPQQAPVISETVDVSIVNVDVFVTDRDGKRVRGLKKEDFEIYDGKVRQTISNFSEYSSVASADDAEPGGQIAPPQKRTVVMFFERTEQIDFAEAERFAARARQTLDALVRPEDSVMLVLWDELAKIEWIEGRDAIHATLEGLPKMFNVGNANRDARTYPSTWLEEETREFDAMIAGGKNAASSAPPNGQLGTARNLRLIQLNDRMQQRVSAINAVINAMAAAEGKKILILAPQSLGEIGLLESSAVARNPYGKGNVESTGMIARLVESANASGVTIYTIYATRIAGALPDATSRGFASAPNSASSVNQAQALASVAADTGGLTARSFGDAVDLLPRIEEDVTDYYSLAFRSDSSSRVHDIEVWTKNPDYVVRSRRQYVDKSDGRRVADRVTAALLYPPQNPFGLTATIGAIAKSAGKETVPLAIRIPIAALTTLPADNKHAGAFEVWVGAGSSKGLLAPIVQKVQNYELADLAASRNGFFTYRLEVVVDRNVDRLAVAVVDAVSRESSLIRVPIERH